MHGMQTYILYTSSQMHVLARKGLERTYHVKVVSRQLSAGPHYIPSPAKGTLLCPIVALAQCGRHINVTSGMRVRTTCIMRFTFRKQQLSLRIYTLRNL